MSIQFLYIGGHCEWQRTPRMTVAMHRLKSELQGSEAASAFRSVDEILGPPECSGTRALEGISVMRSRTSKIHCAAWLMLSASAALAYEPTTHQVLSQLAAQRSKVYGDRPCTLIWACPSAAASP